MVAGAAGGLAVGAVGGALVTHALGTSYYARSLVLPFLASTTLLSTSTKTRKSVGLMLIRILYRRR